MKEMIKKVRERREGFTMAELLIVVAIIAVLVAIAIPVFNAQLEKSKEGTDLANIRAAYAECAAEVVTNSAAGASKAVELKQDDISSWKISPTEVAGLDVSSSGVITAKNMYVNVASDGTFSMSSSAAYTVLP